MDIDPLHAKETWHICRQRPVNRQLVYYKTDNDDDDDDADDADAHRAALNDLNPGRLSYSSPEVKISVVLPEHIFVTTN